MLVLLDTTVLTNFAIVGLTSIPKDLWGDHACTTSNVLEEYATGVETEKLPRVDWTQLNIITLSSELPRRSYLGYRGFITLEAERELA